MTLGIDECPEAIQNEFASGLASYNPFVERAQLRSFKQGILAAVSLGLSVIHRSYAEFARYHCFVKSRKFPDIMSIVMSRSVCW